MCATPSSVAVLLVVLVEQQEYLDEQWLISGVARVYLVLAVLVSPIRQHNTDNNSMRKVRVRCPFISRYYKNSHEKDFQLREAWVWMLCGRA